jgi:hypothetical protein
VRTLQVVTGAGGGDCGFGFEVGERYLVYASRRESGELTTGICSRTNLLAKAAGDVAFLRSMPATGPRGRVFGRVIEVQREPGAYGATERRAVAGIRITVQSGAFERDVLSDASGRYEVTGVPVGKAKVQVNAPFGYDPRALARDIDITDPRACSAVDFYLSLHATASGTVIDATGRPAARVNIDVLPADLAGTDPPRRRFVVTDDRGVFIFDDLAPGRYVFGVNITKPLRRTPRGASVFLPGVLNASDAKVVELSAGDEVNVGVLRLPGR